MISLPAIALALLGMGSSVGGRAADAVPPADRSHAGAASGVNQAGTAPSPVQDALRSRSYPWYDPDADRLRPVWPARASWLKRLLDRLEQAFKSILRFMKWLNFGTGGNSPIVGNSIATVLLLAALTAVFAVLVYLWARRDWMAVAGRSQTARLGSVARLDQLPEGIRPGSDDPWAEALRRRAAGDLAGAIVCLFAHQLLCLDQLGLIRLGPGRTGRQYVHGLRDRQLVDSIDDTLKLFEQVYYGNQVPAAPAFELAWSRAQEFEERRGLLGASR